jgi:hypothetical protein
VVNTEYANAIYYINDRIREKCGDGTVCLTPVTQVAAAAPAPTAPGPCVITAVPAAGLPVQRGDKLTFFVDRPCTTTTTASPTATTEPTTEPPTEPTPPPVVTDPVAPTRPTRVPLEPSVLAPVTGGGVTSALRPRPRPSAVVVDPSPAQVQQQAPDEGTPSP